MAGNGDRYQKNKEFLHIKGAREHNLKNIDVRIPRDSMTVITGLSGSGKSSLAFDTIYAEGQRRYVESLSAYARQFLGLMEKPDVDFIEGLSPAISIEQKGTAKNPRSTVGTVTEIYDYLRLLFARVGVPHCVKCGQPITQQTVEQIVDSILSFEEGTRLMVLAPLVRGKKGEHKDIIDEAKREGFVRLRIDGEVVETDSEIELDKNKKHTIEAVVDRLVVKTTSKRRLADSVETALKMGKGTVLVNIKKQDLLYSEQFACLNCNISYEEADPASVLVQLAVRRLQGVRWSRAEDGDRSRSGDSGSDSFDRQWRDPSLGRRGYVQLVPVHAQRSGGALRFQILDPVQSDSRKKSAR